MTDSRMGMWPNSDYEKLKEVAEVSYRRKQLNPETTSTLLTAIWILLANEKMQVIFWEGL